MNQAEALIVQYQHGLITEAEATNGLDDLQIRGSFRACRSYLGYDYANQAWLEVGPA